MKKTLLSILLALPLCAMAQTETPTAEAAESSEAVQQTKAEPAISIGVFSYEECWNAMADVQKAKQEIATLREQYIAELKRAEADFNAKYEDFLDQQSKLATSIRQKRQAELQKIMEENLAFKAQSQQNLAATEEAKYAPLKEKLQQTIVHVAKTKGYNMVFNRDNNTVPYIDGVMVTDFTESVIFYLK